MKIGEAISRIDALMHNTYTSEQKLAMLSKADSMVKRNIVDTHEGAEQVIFNGYTAETDLDTQLLVPPPFDELYLRWMEAQIHYHDGEYTKYNNAILLFNTELEAYARDYNRTHKGLDTGRRFLF